MSISKPWSQALLALALCTAASCAQASAIPAFTVASTGADPVSTTAAVDYYCTQHDCVTSSTGIIWANNYPLEIRALADALKNDVDLIYEYVRNNIEIVPIFGLQKGALGALIDRSGTAFDQAQLMVELLRQSGYTASYIRGTATLTGAQLEAWLGTQNLAAVKRIFADGGIPANVTASGLNVGTITFLHVWVQVDIGGTNYVFDPSYKPHARTSPINLGTAMGWSETSFLNAAQSGMSSGFQTATSGTSNTGSVQIPYVSNVNGGGASTQLTSYANTLVAYLRSNGYASKQIDDVIGRKDIVAASDIVRQTTLAYGTASAAWAAGVPDIFRTRVTIEMVLLNTTTAVLTQTLYADEIYGRRVAYDNYLNSSGWSECTTRFKVDGLYYGPTYTCADGPSGRHEYVRISIDHPYAANSGSYLDLTGNNAVLKDADFTSPVAIVLGLGEVSDRLQTKLVAEQDYDRLLPETSPCSGCENEPDKPEQPNGESSITQAYSGWLAQYSRMAMIQSRQLSAVHQQHHSVGVAYRRSLVTSTIPVGSNNWSVSQGGLVIDVDTAVSLNSENGSTTNRSTLSRSLSAAADTLEGSQFEQLSGTATPASVAHRFQSGTAETASMRYYLLTSAATTDDFFPQGPAPYFYPSVYDDTALYTAANYRVLVAANQFMGPGRKCLNGTDTCQTSSEVAYLERGAAFQAFAADGVTTASIVTDAQGRRYKGGSAGDPPVYDTEYAPDHSADLVKDQFKDRSNDLGVDLAGGDFSYSPGEDVSVGLGEFPYRLSLQRSFKPGAAHSPGLGKGWTHNLDHRIAMGSSGAEALGQSSTLEAAGTLVALYATQQIYATEPGTNVNLLRRWVLAPFIQAWWAEQIRFNAVTYTAGGTSKVFVRLPDGSFNPPSGYQPGDGSRYWQLTQTGAPYGYGLKWNYSNVGFTLTSPAKDVQTFGHWYRYNQDPVQPYHYGGHHGWHLTTWNWPQGVSLSLGYVASANPNYSDDLLAYVQNSLGRRINLVFGSNQSDWDACNFQSADDNLGHSTTYDCASATTTHPVNAYNVTSEVSRVTYGPGNCNLGSWPDRTIRPRCAPYLTDTYSASDTVNAKAHLTYDEVGRVSKYKDAQAIEYPGTRNATLFYISGGTRGERVDPAGNSYTVYYDPWTRATSFTDELGRTSTAQYDGLNRVIERVSPGGIQTGFQYDFRGSVTQLSQTPSQLLTPVVPASLTVNATYDPGCGKIKTVTDAKGKLTTWTYNATTCQVSTVEQAAVFDAKNNLSNIKPTTQYFYTSAGLIDYLLDPTNIKVDYDYDGSGNRTGRHVDPAGLNFTTTYGYDTRGNISSVTDGRSHTTAYTYDDSRRVYRVTEPTPTCGRTDIVYTGGLKTAVKRAKVCSPNLNNAAHWQTTTTSYTATDQVDIVTDPDGYTTDTNYDALDRPQDVIQQIDSGVSRTTRTKYDDAGQVIKLFKGFGSTDQITYATYTYTPDGQTATVADANSNLTTYLYDGYGRLWRSCFPGATHCSTTPGGSALYEEYGYDDNGNLTSKRNRNGKTISTAYDDLNRETSRTVPANAAGHYARTLTTNYDLASRKWDVTADGQTLKHRYDNAGRLNQVQDSLLNALGSTVGNVTYTYNAAGSRETVTAYSLGSSWAPTYTYDNGERLDTITSGATPLADYAYDPLSRVGTLSYFDGTSTAYTYENDDDLQSLTQTYSGGSLVYGFTHNGAHQITTQTVSDNAYEYKPATPTTAYTPNSLNQYANVGGTTYSYDANGNLTSDGSNTYEYDEENRLRKAGTSTYAYDPLGRRRSKTVGGVTTYFVSDGANEVMDLSSTGQRLHLAVFLDVADPARDQPLRIQRIALQPVVGELLQRRDQRRVAYRLGDLQADHTGLTAAEDFAGAAQLQVGLRDLEAVGGRAHRFEPAFRGVRQRYLVHQHALAGSGAAADAAAQLVQLRQAETLGVFDDHDAGVGHVDADFDHRGRDQQLRLAVLERVHLRVLFVGLQTPVNQADAQIRQIGAQLFGRGFGGLRVELVGLLDQRADPVNLAACTRGFTDASEHVVALVVVDHHGRHRRAARRQLVDHRHVEIRIQRLRQRARDRRRRHDHLVRRGSLGPLVAQRQALLHAEAVLLVDDDQRKTIEGDAALKHRMRADDDGRGAASDASQPPFALALLHLAGEVFDLDVQRREPARQVGVVLLGEQLGRRHQRALITAACGGEHRRCGHHRLAAADIALHQPQHRPTRRKIDADFGYHAALRLSEAERQHRFERVGAAIQIRELRRRPRANLATQQAHAQLVREQLLADQPLLRRMGSFDQQSGLVRAAGRMQAAQRRQRIRRRQARQLRGQMHVGRGEFQSGFDQPAQPRLGDAGGQRIDRRQRVADLERGGIVGDAIFGMHHLRPLRTEAHRAVSLHPAALDEGRLLARIEMEEAQQQAAVTVGNHDPQLAPAGITHVGNLDPRPHQRVGAVREVGQRGDVAAVLVARRQMKQQIADRLQAQIA